MSKGDNPIKSSRGNGGKYKKLEVREMNPIQFKEQNVTYIAEGCNDLPAHKAKDQIISCWKLTKEELEQINKTGVIWFSVMGQSQPPIWLGTENPFKEEEAREMITG